MRIGAHVDSVDPLAEAAIRDADAVQFFLSDPQGWKAPKPRDDAAALRDADVEIYIHAPYLVNVATTNNKIRIPSRKNLMNHAEGAAAIGAAGLIVHGGHVNAGDDPQAGFDNWRKLFAYAADSGGFPLPILIENTAGGENACARRLDDIARLWDAIAEFEVGFCLDTCHAYSAGEDLVDIVERVRAITGRIDLVHANDSKDPFGSSRDRHDNFGQGTIDPKLIAGVAKAAAATVIVETPADGQRDDIALLRSELGL